MTSLRKTGMVAVLALALGATYLELHFGTFSTLWMWVQTLAIVQQRVLHRQLADALRLVAENPTTATIGLVWLSFLYGLLHAVGPGHGKIVVATYLATRPTRIAASLMLTASASLLQGLTAIVGVQLAVWGLGWTFRDTGEMLTVLTSVSFGLVALLGLYLSWQGFRRLRRSGRNGPDASGGHAPEGHTCCGHDHVIPEPSGDTMRERIGLVLSIGLRPCSGAVLVLALANVLGILWGGILAVLAMSLGTALAICVLALLTVYSRSLALWLSSDSAWVHRRSAQIGALILLCGGLAITAAGALLLNANLAMRSHPLM